MRTAGLAPPDRRRLGQNDGATALASSSRDKSRAATGSTTARIPLKESQAKPNESKQKGLDLLGFIRPNRAFSMACDESK
jgi:hypothetical protein